MPVTIQLADQGRGIVIKCAGRLARTDIIDAQIAFLRQNLAACKGVRYCYSNVDEGVEGHLSTEDIMMLARSVAKAAADNPNLAVAISAPRILHYGLSRMWQSFMIDTGWKIEVFHEPSDAKDWLRKTVEEDLTFEWPR